MIRIRSSLQAFGLAAALAVAGAGWALARGQAPAVGVVVICTGTGLVSIALDADGNPTGAHLLCPDCLTIGLALLPERAPATAAPIRAARASWPAALGAETLPQPARRARAPPFPV